MDAEDDAPDVPLSAEERRLGFEVQTVTYGDGGEDLPLLRSGGGMGRCRTAVLAAGEGRRVTRRSGQATYVLEVFDGVGWRVAERFGSVEELAASPVCRHPARDRVGGTPDAEAAGTGAGGED